jgi:hypothetical protein
MLERFRESRVLRQGRTYALASVLAVSGLAAASSAPRPVEAGGERSISCSDTNKWYTLRQGEEVNLRTRAAVATADLTVDGVRQYDNRAETSTVLGFKSANRDKKNWQLDVDFDGAILVLKCGATDKAFFNAYGRETFRQDARSGVNNADKTTNSQSLVK